MQDIVVRVANEADLDALEQLEREAWRPATSPHPVYDGPVFGRRLPLGDVLVACVFERLLGYVAIGRRTPFTSNSHIGVIRSIVVHSEARHRGVGRRLLVAAEAEARRRGFRALRLTVMASNEAARALYRAAGYEELGRYPDEFKVEEGYVDDIFLGKRLEVNA